MRSGLTLAGILIALAIVALLTKKQLTAPKMAPHSAVPLPATTGNETAREQSQQLQQQVQQQLDEAMQQRPKPGDFE